MSEAKDKIFDRLEVVMRLCLVQCRIQAEARTKKESNDNVVY